MKAKQSFKPTDILVEVLKEESLVFKIICHMGMSLFFSNRTIEEVCEGEGIDCATFLSIVNFSTGRPFSLAQVSLPVLVALLESNHAYFLNYSFPTIRKHLLNSSNLSQKSKRVQFLKLFDVFIEKFKRHMEYEQTHTFPIVRALDDSKIRRHHSMQGFIKKHRTLELEIASLKDRIINLYPNKFTIELDPVLVEMIECERALLLHRRIEDDMLLPLIIKQLDDSSLSGKSDVPMDRTPQHAGEKSLQGLSSREMEVVYYVASGLTTGQIAERLHLSLHTITTYRYKICKKIGIGTISGITAFAIQHQIIDAETILSISSSKL